MVKSFRSITEDNLLGRWASFLEIQAELCIKKDVDFMSRLGLSESDQPILDLGCGVGAYARQLRKYFPKSKIVATDINKDLIQIFQEKLKSKPDPLMEVLQWDSTIENIHLSIKESRACIMRLVLQHMTDPKSVLALLKNELQKGSKLFVIEEDDGFFQVYPEFPTFGRILKAWSDYGKKYVNARYMGRTIPYMLSEAGFKVNHSEVVSHTNFDWGMDNTIKFFIGTLDLIHASNPEIITPEEINQVEADFVKYKNEYQGHCLIVYPQVITVAEVP